MFFHRLDNSNPQEQNPITIVLDSPPETTRPEAVDFLAPNLNLKEEFIPFEDEEEDEVEVEIIHITELRSNRLRQPVMIFDFYRRPPDIVLPFVPPETFASK